MTDEATGNVPPKASERSDAAAPADAPRPAGEGAPGDAGAQASPGTEAEAGPSDDRPLDAEKLLRLANLAGQVLEEARNLDPEDDGTVQHLAALHDRVTSQLHAALPNFLVEELEAMDLDEGFADGATPQEVRIAYAGLIGWLGGLLQGLQTAMRMSTFNQLQEGRQAAGAIPPGGGPGPATGHYL